MSPLLAQLLASGRTDFNRRYAEARLQFPDLNAERFSAVLRELADPLVTAAENVQSGGGAHVVSAVYDAALTLTAHRLAGADARLSTVNTAWRDLLPVVGHILVLAPERVLSTLTNAACQLASFSSAQGEEWVKEMTRLAPTTAGVDDLLHLGQVVAWKCGLAHYRTGALAAAARLPDGLASRIFASSSTVTWPALHQRFQHDLWFNPGEQERGPGLSIVRHAGAFRGFGGLFPEPPVIQRWQNQWVARSRDEAWLLTADAFGATFHRISTADLPPPILGVSSFLPQGFRLSGTTLSWNSHTLDLASYGRITSCAFAEGSPAMALTARATHHILLIVGSPGQ
ncbi:MAG TPA: hypothetical protein PLN52_02340 [Opitutaceae bacterium]|nr:hypothetical protein [Opitutaceae bacterium]